MGHFVLRSFPTVQGPSFIGGARGRRGRRNPAFFPGVLNVVGASAHLGHDPQAVDARFVARFFMASSHLGQRRTGPPQSILWLAFHAVCTSAATEGAHVYVAEWAPFASARACFRRRSAEKAANAASSVSVVPRTTDPRVKRVRSVEHPRGCHLAQVLEVEHDLGYILRLPSKPAGAATERGATEPRPGPRDEKESSAPLRPLGERRRLPSRRSPKT